MTNTTITFSEEELLRMRAFYEGEFLSTKQRLKEIEGVLAKLGATTSNQTISETIKATTQTEPLPKRTRKKKRGPKPTWSKFIFEAAQ